MSDPRSHFVAEKYHDEDDVVGADAGGVGSFVPWIGAIGGILGGSGDKKAAPSGESEALKLVIAQQQQQVAAQQAAAARTQTYVLAGLGVATLGTVLYFALRR